MSSPLQKIMDDAAIKEFANDLRDMTAEQMKRELERVTDQIDADTAWQEALTAALRRANQEQSA